MKGKPWPERDALIAREQSEVFERLGEVRGALTTTASAAAIWLPPSPLTRAALANPNPQPKDPNP